MKVSVTESQKWHRPTLGTTVFTSFRTFAGMALLLMSKHVFEVSQFPELHNYKSGVRGKKWRNGHPLGRRFEPTLEGCTCWYA